MIIGLQVIPAENMVAAFQDSNTALYATASTASDAQVYLEALEMGTDGVVLHTDDPLEVFSLKVFFMKSFLMLYLVLCISVHWLSNFVF